jgi:hypothetical protein
MCGVSKLNWTNQERPQIELIYELSPEDNIALKLLLGRSYD